MSNNNQSYHFNALLELVPSTPPNRPRPFGAAFRVSAVRLGVTVVGKKGKLEEFSPWLFVAFEKFTEAILDAYVTFAEPSVSEARGVLLRCFASDKRPRRVPKALETWPTSFQPRGGHSTIERSFDRLTRRKPSMSFQPSATFLKKGL